MEQSNWKKMLDEEEYLPDTGMAEKPIHAVRGCALSTAARPESRNGRNFCGTFSAQSGSM